MSSYRGPWDGGPPGAEAEYAQQGQAPPSTDPWTGASYAQYASSYDYSAYPYPYSYDSTYYQPQTSDPYYGKYPENASYATQQQQTYEYQSRSGERPHTHTPPRANDYQRRSSYRSKSRSHSPYDRRERSYSRKRDSYESDSRRRRTRSRSNPKHKKYSSSDRSSSRSYSRSPKRDKRRRNSKSSDSFASRKSYRNRSSKSRDRSLTPNSPTRPRSPHSRNTPKKSRSPRKSRSASAPPKKVKEKSKSSKDKPKSKRTRNVVTPPKKKPKPTKTHKEVDRSSLTPPNSYKRVERSVTPSKDYKHKDKKIERKSRKHSDSSSNSYRSHSSSVSKSRSRSYSRSSSKDRARRNSKSRSRSRSRSHTPSRPMTKRSTKKSARHSRSRSNSQRRSTSKTRSRSNRRSRSKGNRRSHSPRPDKSAVASQDDSSEDDRRGQFTVADRKRFWKLHRSRQEERGRDKTPPKEIKPPPGALESTQVDDIEYGDPPEVEGPNFAELLTPVDQAFPSASTSKKPLPIPIKNDGSFLEMFKKMQEVTKKTEEVKKPEIKKPALPFIGKRRGGRVLKTGLVKKAKAIDEQCVDNTPKDAWSLYMQEVKKYRETSCEEERKTRPLVK